ncbi:hypothetical protein GW17_00049473 [Ensete ventricosum]|nr:hypothetical protein GW17_00049473 [Ensete ventricosum]RZR98425.1 hypothetical protein BHM03_00027779 [Ensete ventricosum]
MQRHPTWEKRSIHGEARTLELGEGVAAIVPNSPREEAGDQEDESVDEPRHGGVWPEAVSGAAGVPHERVPLPAAAAIVVVVVAAESLHAGVQLVACIQLITERGRWKTPSGEEEMAMEKEGDGRWWRDAFRLPQGIQSPVELKPKCSRFL